MFKFFKKIAAKAIPENSESIQQTIEKVHYEFDSAAERLLKEAKEILGQKDESIADKAERLKKLGFTVSKAVVEANAQEQKVAESKRVAESIIYFQQWYPNQKFITQNEVEAICKKYGLLFGEAAYYKGDIPEKNLAEIEAFKLREEDMQDDYNLRPSYTGGLGSLLAQSNAERYDPFNDIRLMQSQSKLHRYLEQAMQVQQMPSYIAEPTGKKKKSPFKICAPEKDFDTRYMTVIDGYKLQYDPIVLQPVNNGFLIISKWGLPDEANKELSNPKMN